jgi:sulfite exporter TauE/SafE
MAKRQSKNKDLATSSAEWRARLIKLLWGFVIIICVFFGYSYGYPLVAEGQIVKGILTGLAYGAGALIAILLSFFLNRKLRGL